MKKNFMGDNLIFHNVVKYDNFHRVFYMMTIICGFLNLDINLKSRSGLEQC